MTRAHAIETGHGRISIAESKGGPVVLLIHGNSSCKEVFRNQFDGDLGRRYRMIAMDLPGHGASEDARDTERGYTMPRYADAAVQVLAGCGV